MPKRATDKTPRLCAFEECGREFIPKWKNHKCCSKQCASQVGRRSASKTFESRRIHKICAKEGCEKTFLVPPSRSGQKYCSQSCGRKSLKGRKLSEEQRAQRSVQSKRNWQDPKYRQKMLAILNSLERKNKQTLVMNQLWEDPEFRRRHSCGRQRFRDLLDQDPNFREQFSAVISESSKRNWQDPEYRKKMSNARKCMWQDPEYRKKMSNARKCLWQDPEYKERMIALFNDPERKAKASVTQERKWQDPEYRKKMSNSIKRQWRNLEFRAMQSLRMSIESKQRWQDPDFKKNTSRRISIGLTQRLANDPKLKAKYAYHARINSIRSAMSILILRDLGFSDELKRGVNDTAEHCSTPIRSLYLSLGTTIIKELGPEIEHELDTAVNKVMKGEAR